MILIKCKTFVYKTFSCSDLFKSGGLGTGNYIMAFHALRLAVQQIGNIDVSIQCYDANEYRNSLISPWLMGHFSRKFWSKTPGKERKNLTIEEACKVITPAYMIPHMVFELMRMAIATAEVSSLRHPSIAWAKQNLWSEHDAVSTLKKMQLPAPDKDSPHAYPDAEIDDAALHFRNRDKMDLDDTRFGFMKFGSYSKYISPNVRSIGIITQPFYDKGQQRNMDMSANRYEKCKKVVFEFVEHLREVFPDPKIRITIRNNEDETVTLAYACMILANQTIIGTTSFGALAGLTTFGTIYIVKTTHRQWPNTWLMSPVATQLASNIQLIDELVMLAKTCQDNWGV